jgi:hypothetical protein
LRLESDVGECTMVSKRGVSEAEDTQRVGTFQSDVVLALLRAFDSEETAEERQSLTELIEALDEDRPEGLKHFPTQ